jgi:hypothetical protein
MLDILDFPTCTIDIAILLQSKTQQYQPPNYKYMKI